MSAISAPLRWFSAALFCASALPASAASFACAKAASAVETAVCADPALSVLDGRLAERVAAAMARSLDPAGLRAEQRDWLTRLRKEAPGREGIAGAYDHRIAALDRQIAWLGAIDGARDTTEAAARTGCPKVFDDPVGSVGACTVAGFGPLGQVAGRTFFYGLYRSGFPDAATEAAMRIAVTVYVGTGGGRLRLLFAPEANGVYYDKPKLLRVGGRTLLHLPGYEDGTGNFNRERLFVWHGAWADADVAGWLDDLARRLPKGYGAWKGIFPDYAKMTAATPLWREDSDGNCCPTGGRADIALGWRGDRLTVRSVQVKLGANYAEQF